MASGVQSIRLCIQAFRHSPAPRKAGARVYVARRPFSSIPPRWRSATRKNDTEDQEEYEGEDDDDVDPVELERSFRSVLKNSGADVEALTRFHEQTIGATAPILSRAQKLPTGNLRKSFWQAGEDDPDLIVDDQDEDVFEEDDILGMAHSKLEEFREHREYARLAAWEMPLLSKLARPFEPPTAEEPLRFRYTSYMGEFHPAESKVVVEFSPRDLPLDDAQQLKLKKLLGPRFNPETEVAKMSCEQFEHQAQNKRYLGDLVEKLVARAKDPSDMFEDIPLDTRHHRFKTKPKFPREWRMSEDRRKFLEDTRQKSLLLDQTKEEAGSLVNGKERIEQFFIDNPIEITVRDPVKARLNKPSLRSK
ncbi:mitochondrial ribosomal protein [Annulohypoxylon maeteangense]|uniref:mitochondrial ribosomal protein n=1 Tax=Annulohypoxylon maeteangense TaxID=1927788 RepID=UPI0020082B9B|nr:mitochondrial ribosomal protein [Annulohypoxylon maeteangense]KAI0885586.1 mitochondrial ribosomal protein [Annulohypoxylon maeteangense]